MKRLLLGGVTLVTLVALSVGAANTADVPAAPVYKAPVVAPVAWSWTGWYIGVNAGYTLSTGNSVDTVGTATFANPAFLLGSTAIANALALVGTNSLPVKTNGFIGGGQIGYNYQFTNNFVTGIEADIQGVASASSSATLTKTTVVVPFRAETYVSTASVAKRLDYLGTVRGRLGFLVTPTLLAYATGGLAYGGISTSTSFNAVESLGNPPYPPVLGASVFSGARVGWTAGAGLEWLLAANWSAKVEYLHYDLGSVTSGLIMTQINLITGSPAPWGSALVTSRTRFNGHIARVGLNYKL